MLARPMFIDTHCHLDDPAYSPDLDRVLVRAREAGVAGFVSAGVSPDGWSRARDLAFRYPEIRCAFGLHPMHADAFDAAVVEELRRLLPGAVAVGEIGLDSACPVPRQSQAEAFRAQLRVAVVAGLPVIIHCRRAFRDFLQIWSEEGGARVGGVMHAFSGSVETCRECVRAGLCIGIAGPVTWDGAVKPEAVAAEVPSDRILLETDSPDLTPAPWRGTRNEPAYLPEIARRVAEIRGVMIEELARTTTENAQRLFRL